MKKIVTALTFLIMLATSMVCMAGGETKNIPFINGYTDASGIYHGGYYALPNAPLVQPQSASFQPVTPYFYTQTIVVPEGKERVFSGVSENHVPVALPNRTVGQESR